MKIGDLVAVRAQSLTGDKRGFRHGQIMYKDPSSLSPELVYVVAGTSLLVIDVSEDQRRLCVLHPEFGAITCVSDHVDVLVGK